MEADLSIDTLGLYCPIPIVKTAKAIQGMQPGQVLEVLSDDEGIKKDLPTWCKSSGHEFLGMEDDDGEYRGYVRKH